MILFSPLSKFELELDDILRKELDKQLFNTKQDDLLRLLKLRLWAERYSVSLAYIVRKLIPHYERISQRHYLRRTSNSRGLGVPVSILTGPAAEKLLQEWIRKDFPDEEHLTTFREEYREACLDKLEINKPLSRPRPILHFTTIKSYVDSYVDKIERKRKSFRKADRKLAKMPWRGNPFR